MLVRTDSFREFDRLLQQTFGTMMRPAVIPMDAWRDGDEFVVAFDLPGAEPDSIDIDIERNVLTVRAERRPPTADGGDLVIAERPSGVFSRQLIVGDTLDTDRIRASFDTGVLLLRIPIAEKAKPRKVSVSVVNANPKMIDESTAEPQALVGAMT